MTWIIIAVLLIAAFGPIAWLMPSASQRRIGALRQQAYGHGLRVELRRLPGRDVAPQARVTAGGRALDTSTECAVYLAPLPRRLKRLPTGRVLRGGAGEVVAAGWAFEPGKRPVDPALPTWQQALVGVLEALPDDVVGVEVDTHAVGAYWLEGPGSSGVEVDALAEQLHAAAQALGAADAALAEPGEPGNI